MLLLLLPVALADDLGDLRGLFGAGSPASPGCIPDGSALYPAVKEPLDAARVEALVGPTLAALVATWAPHTYNPNGWGDHWVQPFDGSTLPTEVRVPLQAPAPLTAALTLELGTRACLPLAVSSWSRQAPTVTWEDGQVALTAPVSGRVELAWHGRTISTLPLADVDGWILHWDTGGALLYPGNLGCGPFRLTGAPEEGERDFPCFPEPWVATLAGGAWPRSERAAIVALLARRSFDAFSIEAQAALVARTDLTREEKLAIGVPEPKSAVGVATIRGKGLRIAVDGVEAKGWVDAPDGRQVKVPARGLAKVTVQHADNPDGHWTWDMWIGDGTDVNVSLHWGPGLNGPPGDRCGEVVGDAAWQCELNPVHPGETFRLPCGGPAANGAMSFVGVKHGDLAHGGELTGLGFVAGLPGRYRFSEVDGRVTVARVADTCDGG